MLHAGVLIEQHSWIGDPLKNKRRQNRDYSVFAYIARQCAYLFSCLLILNTLKKQLSWRFRIWETSGRSFQKEAPYPLCNWRTASLQSVWKLSSLQCEGPFYICRVKGSSRYKDGGRSKWGQVLISLILAVSSVSLLTWSGCVGELTEKANMFELWMPAITSWEILLIVTMQILSRASTSSSVIIRKIMYQHTEAKLMIQSYICTQENNSCCQQKACPSLDTTIQSK